jgi:hypothetical protein
MDCAYGKQTAVIRVRDWEEARRIGISMKRWLFRGQANTEWTLKSSLERAFESRGIPTARTGPIEEMMLMEFRSLAHLFAASLPSEEDIIAWLTLIRHHGGPTRLLDFTESFYVATYFALDSAIEECAIWAFNRIDQMSKVMDLVDGLCGLLRIDKHVSVGEKFDQILIKAIQGDVHENHILIMSPSQRNERQFLQQALAMIPLNLQEGFMGTLLRSFEPPGEMPTEDSFVEVEFDELQRVIRDSKLVKLVIAKDAFLDARLDLEQMNINGATLFRGLDGLGRKVQDVLNSVESYLRERDGVGTLVQSEHIL